MKWIVVFTHSGFTARLISRYRPLVPIAAFSPEADIRRRLALVWGVAPLGIPDLRKVDQLAEISEKRLLEEKLVRRGDVIAIVAGTPMGVRGTTNFMKFHDRRRVAIVFVRRWDSEPALIAVVDKRVEHLPDRPGRF